MRLLITTQQSSVVSRGFGRSKKFASGDIGEVTPEIEDRLEILLRVCNRARLHFLAIGDSRGVDCFQHMADEVALLRRAIIDSEMRSVRYRGRRTQAH